MAKDLTAKETAALQRKLIAKKASPSTGAGRDGYVRGNKPSTPTSSTAKKPSPGTKKSAPSKKVNMGAGYSESDDGQVKSGKKK